MKKAYAGAYFLRAATLRRVLQSCGMCFLRAFPNKRNKKTGNPDKIVRFLTFENSEISLFQNTKSRVFVRDPDINS